MCRKNKRDEEIDRTCFEDEQLNPSNSKPTGVYNNGEYETIKSFNIFVNSVIYLNVCIYNVV